MSPAPRHPSEDALLALASGEADGPLVLLLEAHLQRCDDCAGRMRALSLAGGALLEAVPPEPVSPDAFDRLWARVEALPAPAAMPQGLPDLPPALAARAAAARPWRWSRLFTRGMDNLKLMLDPRTGASLYLIRLHPGGGFPRHRHRGGEDALILAGGCQDGAQTLEAGDWMSYPAGSVHAPVGDPEEGCWILTRVEQDEVAFRGWRGLLQGAWEGIRGRA
ncbi:MAG TPA: cupin domain-containing protein [Holophagaceae bacterium]|nr:cupin domain-containing protein [Holophagaceae bacterium]